MDHLRGRFLKLFGCFGQRALFSQLSALTKMLGKAF
jgi:hypothetical protein